VEEITMAIVRKWDFMSLAELDDPDDYRPNSELAMIIDPERADGDFVAGLTVFHERIGPGDRIPLHQHTVEEVLFLDSGSVEVTLGEERETIEDGAVVFIPARIPHGFRNVGDEVARIHAVFPSAEVTIRYLDRNPAPGTEEDQPGSPLAFNVRELLEGDPEEAIRPLDEAEFTSNR
jgi:quercetin dioxygenase-like cupin family protein